MLTDKPYDEAKKRWILMAAYAIPFGIMGVIVRYVLPNLHF